MQLNSHPDAAGHGGTCPEPATSLHQCPGSGLLVSHLVFWGPGGSLEARERGVGGSQGLKERLCFGILLQMFIWEGGFYSLKRSCFCFCFLFVLSGVALAYTVVLISGIWQSDSVIHKHISILFQILSRIGYYRVLRRVPCAIQWVLAGCLFYI